MQIKRYLTHVQSAPVAASESARAAAGGVVSPLQSRPVDGPESRVAARAGSPPLQKTSAVKFLDRLHLGTVSGNRLITPVDSDVPAPPR